MIVLLVLVIMPILEIVTAIAVAQWIGAVPTMALLLGLSVLGFVLIRSEGLSVWRKANAEIAAGQPPADTLTDGLLVVVGGSLLILPGFLTAIPGLLLLFPPTRSLLRPAVARWFERRAARSATFVTASFGGTGVGGQGFGSVFDQAAGFGRMRGRVVDADAHEADVPAAYAEVIDIEVDAPRELDPPR